MRLNTTLLTFCKACTSRNDPINAAHFSGVKRNQYSSKAAKKCQMHTEIRVKRRDYTTRHCWSQSSNRNPYRLEFGRFEINQTTGRPRGLFTLKGKRRKSEEKSNKKINNKANSIQDDLKKYVVTIGHDQKEHSEVTYAKAFHTLVVKRGKLPK